MAKNVPFTERREFSTYTCKGVYKTYINYAKLLENCFLNIRFSLLPIQSRKLLLQLILKMLITGINIKIKLKLGMFKTWVPLPDPRACSVGKQSKNTIADSLKKIIKV